MPAVCPNPSGQQPCPPHINRWSTLNLLTSTVLLGEHFVLSCPALMETIPSVCPDTDLWGTALCRDCQLDSLALWILAAQSILFLPCCPHLQLSLTDWVTRQLCAKSLPRVSFTSSDIFIIPWLSACPSRLSNLCISVLLLWVLLHPHRKKWKDVLPEKLKGN